MKSQNTDTSIQVKNSVELLIIIKIKINKNNEGIESELDK